MILGYVVDGSGTVDSLNRDTIELANRSSDLAAIDVITADPITTTAGSDGPTLYQIIGTGRPTLSDSRNVSSLLLESFTTDSLTTPSDIPGSTAGVRVTLRVAVGLGPDDGQNSGGDSTFTAMTPLIGDALVTSRTGDDIITGSVDSVASAMLTTPLIFPVGGAILIDPGADLRVAPVDARLSVLWANIQIASGESATDSVNLTIATPIEGTPIRALRAAPD